MSPCNYYSIQIWAASLDLYFFPPFLVGGAGTHATASQFSFEISLPVQKEILIKSQNWLAQLVLFLTLIGSRPPKTATVIIYNSRVYYLCYYLCFMWHSEECKGIKTIEKWEDYHLYYSAFVVKMHIQNAFKRMCLRDLWWKRSVNTSWDIMWPYHICSLKICYWPQGTVWNLKLWKWISLTWDTSIIFRRNFRTFILNSGVPVLSPAFQGYLQFIGQGWCHGHFEIFYFTIW